MVYIFTCIYIYIYKINTSEDTECFFYKTSYISTSIVWPSSGQNDNYNGKLAILNDYKQRERVHITANIVRAAGQKLHALPTFTILCIEKSVLI